MSLTYTVTFEKGPEMTWQADSAAVMGDTLVLLGPQGRLFLSLYNIRFVSETSGAPWKPSAGAATGKPAQTCTVHPDVKLVPSKTEPGQLVCVQCAGCQGTCAHGRQCPRLKHPEGSAHLCGKDCPPATNKE